MLHLDTLSGLKELNICRAYNINGEEKTFFPANTARLAQARPVYKTVPGWDEDITEVKEFSDLPVNARDYIQQIEELIGKQIRIIGVGPRRDQTLFR
jgi:adenylosuccinate synthase